jgi:hypothetical protein
LKSPQENLRIFKIEVVLNKIVSIDFNKIAVARLQIFTIRFPIISVSHITHETVRGHQICAYGTQRTTASRIQMCKREVAKSCKSSGHFYTVKTDISKAVAFKEAISKNLNMLADLIVEA